MQTKRLSRASRCAARLDVGAVEKAQTTLQSGFNFRGVDVISLLPTNKTKSSQRKERNEANAEFERPVSSDCPTGEVGSVNRLPDVSVCTVRLWARIIAVRRLRYRAYLEIQDADF